MRVGVTLRSALPADGDVTAAVALRRRRARPRGRFASRLAVERVAAGAVFALAAVLRFVAAGRTPLDPFYDGAVRSMGTSWHAFLVGALDPSARVAIDKPPVDLWLQVASTKLLGFNRFALLLPAALGGTLAVVALYDLLRTVAGRRAALFGALALAVLPVSVISSRSDTMDSVMAALVVGALAVAARGLRDGRVRNMVAAGVLVGLAFEVKLFEALLVAMPLGLMWWMGAHATRRRRLVGTGLATASCLAVGLVWLVVVTTAVPASKRPWAFGSTNGSPWNAAFVYDGWDRLSAGSAPGQSGADRAQSDRVPAAAASARARSASARTATGQVPAPAGPVRLLSSQDHLGGRLGIELVAAWLALAALTVGRRWRRLDRLGRAGLAALAVWLALGTVLFSAQGALRPRYLEAFDPAVAACLGAGVALSYERARRFVAPGLAAVLVVSLLTSAAGIAAHAEDSGAPGALPPSRLASLSAYLRAHQDGARFEAATLATSPGAALIANDGRPVLILTALRHPLVTTGQLSRLVAAGEVRDVLLGKADGASLARWVRAHGVDVSRAAGQPPGALYALPRP